VTHTIPPLVVGGLAPDRPLPRPAAFYSVKWYQTRRLWKALVPNSASGAPLAPVLPIPYIAYSASEPEADPWCDMLCSFCSCSRWPA
jgi:hypothetical protein